jgi:raffinose/stachyose/melibiose transport system permease protein
MGEAKPELVRGVRGVGRRRARLRRKLYSYLVGAAAIIGSTIVFVVPFAFVFLTAAKDPAEASQMMFSLPTQWRFFENAVEVLQVRDHMLVRAFINSTLLTVLGVTLMVIFSAMAGYVLQRRRSRWNAVVNFCVLAGLIVPPAVVPTIWALQAVGLFKTLPGMVLIQVTFGLSFCVLLFRAFMTTVPRELDEAAIIDGAGPIRLFFSIILPLMRPVVVTVAVIQAVGLFNDFTGPLYFLPGSDNVTVQLTLYNFMSGGMQQTLNQWNLLFATIVLITIPPLVMYIFFNRQIVAGMTSGALKG